MLSLPLITPRDVSLLVTMNSKKAITRATATNTNQSHELWFGSSQPYRSSCTTPSQQNDSNGNNHNTGNRRHGPSNNSRVASNTLAQLLLEERALRVRKNNIATFGYSWIRPAGCAKTMLGMKEEEAERQEALAAQAAEEAAAAAAAAAEAGGDGEDAFEEGDTGMERDLDDDIPDADADVDAGSDAESEVEGLVEEGEEGLEEEGYMERDLDDDIPEGFPDDEDEDGLEEDEENYEDFDNQPDLDDDIPSGDGGYHDYDDEDVMSQELEEEASDSMARDLDDNIPEAAEDREDQGDEWQHTDTDVEFDDEEDVSFSQDPFTQSLQASTSNSRGLPPPPLPLSSIRRETPAQQRFLQRWSGGGDAFDSSSMLVDEDDLRASMASQASRRSGFGRFPRRRTGGPRDSFS